MGLVAPHVYRADAGRGPSVDAHELRPPAQEVGSPPLGGSHDPGDHASGRPRDDPPADRSAAAESADDPEADQADLSDGGRGRSPRPKSGAQGSGESSR